MVKYIHLRCILCVFLYILVYVSEGCDLKFYKIADFLGHFKRYHSDQLQVLVCQFCGKQIKICDAAVHMLCAHNIGLFDCVNCPFGTDSVRAIRLHMADQHPDELLFVCVRGTKRLNQQVSVTCVFFVVL